MKSINCILPPPIPIHNINHIPNCSRSTKSEWISINGHKLQDYESISVENDDHHQRQFIGFLILFLEYLRFKWTEENEKFMNLKMKKKIKKNVSNEKVVRCQFGIAGSECVVKRTKYMVKNEKGGHQNRYAYKLTEWMFYLFSFIYLVYFINWPTLNTYYYIFIKLFHFHFHLHSIQAQTYTFCSSDSFRMKWKEKTHSKQICVLL